MSPSNLMAEEEAIQRHLTFPPPSNNIQYFSGFVAALRDARQVNGRDLETGAKIPSAPRAIWLGAIGYLALLDQIGSCFKPKPSRIEQGNAINKALKYFSSLTENAIDALYALRCAFAHDYSLHNIPKDKKKLSLQHHFTVDVGSRPLITFPKVQWDGDYNNKNSNNVTIINLEAFGDLVESIYQELLKLAQAKQLEITLQGGSDELVRRYFFSTPTGS
jgi:hypothetical protein